MPRMPLRSGPGAGQFLKTLVASTSEKCLPSCDDPGRAAADVRPVPGREHRGLRPAVAAPHPPALRFGGPGRRLLMGARWGRSRSPAPLSSTSRAEPDCSCSGTIADPVCTALNAVPLRAFPRPRPGRTSRSPGALPSRLPVPASAPPAPTRRASSPRRSVAAPGGVPGPLQQCVQQVPQWPPETLRHRPVPGRSGHRAATAQIRSRAAISLFTGLAHRTPPIWHSTANF